MAQQAFILRMNISGKDRVPMGLEEGQIMIGWSEAKGLLDASDQQTIRRAVQEVYYAKDDHRATRSAGRAAGSLWRFLHGMSEGDLVVVPHGTKFYVAEVTGPACFDAGRIATDTAHFRAVRWLNPEKPFDRTVARSNLRHKMGAGCRGTCGDATYVLPQIQEVIRDFSGEQTVAVPHEPLGLFRKDLFQTLAERALSELLEGKMGERDFERFLLRLFEHLRGKAEIRARRVDKGADLIVEMPLGRSFLSQRIAIQAKYYHPPRLVGVEAVKQLLTGMEAEDVDLGLVITTSDFTDDAHEFVGSDECDRKVELISGEYLARVVVEQGLWR